MLLICCVPHWTSAQGEGLVHTRFQFQEQKMGTTFRIIFYTSNAQHARSTAKAAFNKVDELNKIFSDYETDSEVSRLSEAAGNGRIKVSRELWEVLRISQLISAKSGGAFDVSIGPLSKLWRRAQRRHEFPTEVQIAAAKSKVNYRWIKLYPQSQEVKLVKSGMRLDLGGIAKGYTVDKIKTVLESRGITSFLIDGGGDLLCGDSPPDGSSWQILSEAAEPIALLEPGAIAASGSTYQYLIWQQKKYSHLVHTDTGLGSTDENVYYVKAQNCMIADALASTLGLVDDQTSRKLLSRFKAQRVYPEAIP